MPFASNENSLICSNLTEDLPFDRTFFVWAAEDEFFFCNYPTNFDIALIKLPTLFVFKERFSLGLRLVILY